MNSPASKRELRSMLVVFSKLHILLAMERSGQRRREKGAIGHLVSGAMGMLSRLSRGNESGGFTCGSGTASGPPEL
jgi:hypothetical protein